MKTSAPCAYCGCRDCPIIGGDTPFIPFSDLHRVRTHNKKAGVPETKPFRLIDPAGVDRTRETQFVLCVMEWWMMESGETPAPEGMTLQGFMHGFIAGANTDLRAMAMPMISMAEVERWAHNHAFIAWATAQKEKDAR